MYGIELHLQARGQSGEISAEAIAAHIEQVMDAMADVEACNERLLDWSIASDASTGHTDIEFTAEADNIEEALALAHTWARTAIHAAGGWTPDWTGPGTDPIVGYELGAEGANVRPLVDA